MRVHVERSVLEWAIQRAGKPHEYLSRTFPKWRDWLNGTVLPTYSELRRFASVTHTPFGYLFLDKPPAAELPIPLYRSYGDPHRQDSPSNNLLDTVRAMKGRQEWMRDYMIEEGQDPNPLVRSAQLGESPADVADRIRASLGLSLTWNVDERDDVTALRVFRDAVERAGILVFFNGIVGNNTSRRLEVDEFRGFVLIDDYAPLVFVNSADARVARTFTLAHELAHVAFGLEAAFDLRDARPARQREEQECNAVAAELLVPAHLLRPVWQPGSRQELIAALAQRFKVSRLVIAYRAMDMGLLTSEEFGALRSRLTAPAPAAPASEGGGSFWRNQYWRVGLRFASAVYGAVKSEALLYTDAYNLTDCHGATFDRLLPMLMEVSAVADR